MPGSLIHVCALDVEAGYEDAFGSWYQESHVPAMLSRTGWSGARRYECIDGEPRFLTIYDLQEGTSVVPGSEAPFRSQRFGSRVRNYLSSTLHRIHSAGEDPSCSELVNLITVDVDPEAASGFSRWYNEVHVPEILACPGWRGNQRFESLEDEGSFLAIYGLEDAERPFHTDEYESAVGWDDYVDRIRGYHGFRIYRQTAAIGV